MKNRSTHVEVELLTECMEDAVYVYADIHGHREEMARFLFPQIYNLSDAQLRKISGAAVTAVEDTLNGCVWLIDRPYKVPYKVPKAVKGYVGRVTASSSSLEKMWFTCTQLTCPENTSKIHINNESGWLSAENVDTALQIFKWHSHRFYKSLESLRWQIPRF